MNILPLVFQLFNMAVKLANTACGLHSNHFQDLLLLRYDHRLIVGQTGCVLWKDREEIDLVTRSTFDE